MTFHKIYNMHVLDALQRLPDESVDFVMTSPPYYGLRSYHNADADWNGWRGQLGLEPTYQMYIEHLLMVTKELKRVLKKSGTLFWNMGDSYASSGGPSRHKGYFDPKYPQGRNGSFDEPTSYDQGISPKSLMMIPERLSIGMIDQGWILRNKLIWYKRNALPSSVKDRFSNKYEFVYFFVKSLRYYFNLDVVRKPLKPSSIKRIKQINIDRQFQTGKSSEFAKTNPNMNIKKMITNMHQKYFSEGNYKGSHSGYYNADGTPRVDLNGANPGDVITNDYATWYFQEREKKSWVSHEHDMEMGFGQQKRGQKNIQYPYPYGANPGDIMESQPVNEIPDDIWQAFLEYLEGERPELLMPQVYDIPTKPHSYAHFAIFPETLVEPFMRAGCPSGGVVLDPFAGSGTTAVVGQRMGNSTISIEISPDYVEIIKKRMQWEGLEDKEELK
ncbi:MAG: site-specific DNA-methyltransferase [Candidatus Micrarchaeaceae archaeon]